MKNSMALLAMAASFGPASATFNFGSNWQNAGSYTCPGNSNNECKDEYKGGFDWSDLTTGSFSSYNGFNFNGWSCGESAAWGKRTGGSKVIKASCGKDSTPSFGCGSNSGVDKFTVSHFDIDVEFDCRLEFHYKMPGGSTCKQSSSCKKGGNKISNSQCGGATDVEIHWPEQDSPKPSCGIQIPSIGFDCGDHTPSKTTSVPVVSKTKTHPGGGHGTTSTAVVPSKSHPGGPESSSVVPSKSHPGGPESSSVVPSKSHPGSSVPTKSHPETTPIPSNTGSSVIPSQSSPATTPGGPETTSAPVPSTSEGNSPSSSEEISSSTTEENGPSTTGENSPSTTGNNSPSSPSETQSVPETTITTTWDSTSTIFTTTTRTITSCGPEVPDCPASGTPSTPIIVTETVPVTTTVCPVTETIVPSHTSGNSPVQSSKPPSSGSPSSGVPSSGSVPSASHTSGNSPVQTETPDSPLPCPDVVPKCLNSWLHLVEQCSNNLDVACFCPNSDFVEKTYQCIYSYGGSDDIVAEAAAFFQGMCAGYVGENPAIVTGIDTVTNILTVTGTPVVSVPYTTVVIETTLTEPCVTGGTTIPGSSTIKTISTEVTIPNISVPSATATATAAPSTTGANSPANPTASTLTTKPPVGTISQVVPTTKPTGVPIAAGNNVKASLGLGLAAMLFAAAL
ncbi:unnamed protein product [Clonostachys byssicola]|uniref:CFEM domain-containing protein n=1 Tax=Clonostachys byssicola TaxID=160290 RepID=A0A9N9UST7_9HYPO|nr:unnamed protein product [Clonostachys byssicola]